MNRFEKIQQQKSNISKPRILFILYNNMGSITNRIRGLIFAEPLRELGWAAEYIDVEEATENQLVQMAANFDIIYLLKIPFISLIKKLRQHTRAKLVFDLTDALWMPHHRWNKWQDLEAILSEVDAVFSDNEFVAAYGRKFNQRVHVIPACTQVERFEAIKKNLPPRDDGKIVIGWVGTVSTINALHVIQEPLERIFSRHPDLVLKLLILGFSDRGVLPDFKHVRFSILPKYDEEEMIREVLRMDIGLFPPPCGLEDYAIRGPLKALIYMTGGVPPVCENGGGCAAIIQDGSNGMLAGTAEEWEQKLEFLIASPEARRQMGQNALDTVRKTNSLKAITERLAKAFVDVLYEQSSPKVNSVAPGIPAPLNHSPSGPLQTKKTSMRVMIACSHFWPSIGGVENRIEQFSAFLVAAGYDVTIVTPEFPGRTSNVRNGVRIQSINPATSIDGNPAWPFAVRHALMSGKFDICILVQDPLGNIIWSVEGASPPPSTRLIIQPIINEDGYSKWKDHDSFGPRLAGILKSANAVIAMTRTGPENRFMHDFGVEPTYIPNASSVPEPAGDFRAHYGIPADRFVVLHVANLYWVKNHIGLLESLRDMPKSWLLVMVGNPSGEPECAKKVKEALAGRPDVLYIPGLSREWVSAAMMASDVIVLSSFGEGSPNTILEAMAHGKPWVATPQCGAANDNAGGIICNLAEFKKHLALLKGNPELRLLLGDMGKRHWASCLSWPKVVAGWIDLFENGSLQESFDMPSDIKDTMNRIRNLITNGINQKARTVFPESRHAHHWLDGLRGLEIGPSAQNPFGLATRYVGLQDEIYEEEQVRLTGSAVALDIEALADNIPLPDESEDFILSSHVIEHCPDLITTLLEWFRIVRKGGIIYMIVPLRNAAPSDVGRDITTWRHIQEDFNNQANEHSDPEAGRFGHCHYHVFDIGVLREIIGNIFGDRLQLVDYLEKDDKIGNGFTLVYRKTVACSELSPWEFWQRFKDRRIPVETNKPVFVNIGMITYNRLDFTRQSIDSLVLHTGFPYVLTVVDNASTDGTRDYLLEQKRNGIIKNLVLLDSNIGVAKASNLAWSLEPGAKYYLKLDNDIVIQKTGWLAAMVRVLEGIPALGAVAYSFEPTTYPVHIENGLAIRLKNGNLGGACFLISAATWSRLGYWCEDYGLYSEEDYDYCYRMSRSGIGYAYMEDEDIGIHLPAGKAAKIDEENFEARDGVEEKQQRDYRLWKDEVRRTVVGSGVRDRNLVAYRNGTKSLHAASDTVARWNAAGRPCLVVSSAPVSPAASPLKIAVFSHDHGDHACGYYRLYSPGKALQPQASIDWAVKTEGGSFTIDTQVLEAGDLFVIQRFFPHEMSMQVIGQLMKMGKPVVFEIDDYLTAIPPSNPSYEWAQKCVTHIEDCIRRCDAVTVSTEALKGVYSSLNSSIYVVPNVIDETLWKNTAPPSSGIVVIGFSGTSTHLSDLAFLEDIMERIAAAHPGKVSFTFMGCATERLSRLPGFRYVPFELTYQDYAGKLQQLPMDIALVPLEDNPFNRCKSNVKWLEYSMCGVAGVYADLPPYNSSIDHGTTGLLVGNDPQQWFNAIDLLVRKPELRHFIASNARQEVVSKYTLKAGAHRWLEIYRDIMAQHEANQSTRADVSLPPPKVVDPSARSEKVSIIIPLFNQVAYTKSCLEALKATTPDDLYELILVDNGSSDGTQSLCTGMPATVKTIRNQANQGFAKACNQGAQAAAGKYLLFLNNDTEPQPGWLEALVSIADADATVAGVGSKLLYPDGTIQHAGVSMVDNRVSKDPLCGEHIWKGSRADQPEANLPYRYQALTAACLLVRRDAFEAVQGFDEDYWNGYEDVDLCFKLGQKGWKLVYQPASVVVHHESKSGTERFAAASRNIRRLHEKWLGLIRPDVIITANSAVEQGPGMLTGSIGPYVPGAGKPVPQVSIIIPLYNQAHLTKACVEAVRATAGDPGRYELILVDNGSTDWSPEYLKSLGDSVTVLSNRDNLGFARACNQGAASARGTYLLFLNNDTVPRVGWLDALLQSALDEGADIVGAKLLYPNGRVQHAGVAFNRNGIGYHIFKNFTADSPAVSKKRVMQCVTAACLLVSRQLFRELGGFDEQFRNGFEDVDFCLRAGKAGKQVLYNPESVVVHHEEQSHGRKQYDSQNMRLYLARWQGRIRCDDEELYAAEGFSVDWHADGSCTLRQLGTRQDESENSARYPLVPLVGSYAETPFARFSGSNRMKTILNKYSTGSNAYPEPGI